MTLPNIEGVLLRIDHLIGQGVSPANLPNVYTNSFKNAVQSGSDEVVSPTPPPRVPTPSADEQIPTDPNPRSQGEAIGSLLASNKIHPKSTVYKNTDEK